MLSGHFRPKPKLTVPLVTNLHPAITCLSSMMSTSFSSVCRSDPLLNLLLPTSSLLVSYRKLPNLNRLLCSSDQNKFVSPTSSNDAIGYLDTGCRCMVCKISNFGKYVSPPSMPGYKVPLTGSVSCSSGPAVVYHLVCKSGRPECRRAHYVGMASTTNAKVKPMSSRWSNHKAHHKAGRNLCQMTEHLMTFHQNEDPQDFVSITILEECSDPVVAKRRETIWTFDLFAFYPSGLNRREEVQLA